jgi:arylsulfatase A-like enzyme
MSQMPEPFLLYMPLTSPHTPLSVNEEWIGKSGISLYADFVMETDAIIGRVINALERSGEADNSIIIFTSDNGCAGYVGNTTLEEAKDTTFKSWPYKRKKREDLPIVAMEEKGHYPSGYLRGYKTDVWEGGHRVPFIVKWPGTVKSGSTSTQLVHQADILATIAEILGTRLPIDAGEDSFSLLPLLKRENGYVRVNAVSTAACGLPSLRSGSWKLILGQGSGGNTPGGDGEPVQLYNLASDIGETNNLASEMPERVSEMKILMEKFISDGRSTPGPKQKNDVEVVRFGQ